MTEIIFLRMGRKQQVASVADRIPGEALGEALVKTLERKNKCHTLKTSVTLLCIDRHVPNDTSAIRRSGLVVKFIVAIDEPPVRFRGPAFLVLQWCDDDWGIEFFVCLVNLRRQNAPGCNPNLNVSVGDLDRHR